MIIRERLSPFILELSSDPSLDSIDLFWTGFPLQPSYNIACYYQNAAH